MSTIKIFTILAFVFFAGISATAQTVYTEIYPDKKVAINYEKLDVASYRNKYQGSILDYTYTQDDGTVVQVKSYKKGSNIEVFERPPYPAIHFVYKEFYPNGNLKQKGVLLPLQLKVGKWIEAELNGEFTISDYETGRNGYGYNDILYFLEKNGCYNQDDSNKWECFFWYTPESESWGVRVNKNTHQHKMYVFDSNGEKSIEETDLSPNLNKVEAVGTFEQTEEGSTRKNTGKGDF